MLKQSHDATTVVVQQQPLLAPANTIQHAPSRPEFGIGALVFAIVTTIIMILGCWWGLPCSVAAIVLAMTVSGKSGKNL